METLLKAMEMLPGLVRDAEMGLDLKTGEEKKAAVLKLAKLALNVTDSVTGKQTVDAEGFTRGLGMVVDGMVECLKASGWTSR